MPSNPALYSAHSDVVTRYRQSMKKLIDAQEELRAMHFRWDQENFPEKLVNEAFIGKDGKGDANSGMSRELLTAARAALDGLDAIASKAEGDNLSPFGVLYMVAG